MKVSVPIKKNLCKKCKNSWIEKPYRHKSPQEYPVCPKCRRPNKDLLSITINSIQEKCVRCNHTWIKRKKDSRRCPKCNYSILIGIKNFSCEKMYIKCKRCGKEWSPRKITEKTTCGNCRTINWDKDETTFKKKVAIKCNSCGKIWHPNKITEELRCAKCQSRNWNKQPNTKKGEKK